MIFGLVILGFIVGVAFSALVKTDTAREMVWNIIVAIIAALQGKILSSLVLVDNLAVPSQLILLLWIVGILYLKRLFLKPRPIRYFGE